MRQSVGSGSSSVPVLLGKRLNIEYFTSDAYVEVDVNVHSNAVASSITKMVRGMTRMVVIDIAFLLEGKEEDELPERLIGVFRMDHMRMDAATGADGVRRAADSGASSPASSSRGGWGARSWRGRMSTRRDTPQGREAAPRRGASLHAEGGETFFDCVM